MTRRRAAAVLEGCRRWAPRLALGFVVYLFGMGLAAGWGLPQVVTSPAGAGLAMGAAALLALSAAAPLAAEGPPARRLGTALLRLGLALTLAAPAASLALRRDWGLPVGEGQEIGPAEIPGLPPLRLGQVTVAPRGANALLSKTVAVEAFRPGEPEPLRIGLYPPTFAGGWRFSILKFGYAPAVEWTGPDGRPLARGWVMLGTFPHREEEARLPTWSPEPNVMMGIGTFPPSTEDLITPPGTSMHLFLRIDEATVAGARRDLTRPDSWKYLVEGRLEHPVYFAQVFRGSSKLWEGRLRAGEPADVAGGRLVLPDEVPMWVQLVVVRDPWIHLGLAGLAALAAGGVLRLVARRRAGASAATGD